MGCFKIVEGCVKYRVGRRWKQRWCILQKLSPVSNCVHLCLHKGRQPRSSRAGQPSAVFALEDFCGIDAPFQYDHEQHVMAVVCRQHVVVLALADKSTLDAWCLAVRCHLGCDHRFLVDIAKAPLTLKHNALALLFVHGPTLCLTTRSSQSTGPPSVLASWTVFNLRRFGVLESKFCFQVNDVDGLSVYALSSVSAAEIDRLMREATRKRSTSISCGYADELQVRGELNEYHRRSSHAGTSSLDSSSIYALLSFDSSPDNEHKDCRCTSSDVGSLTVPADLPLYCKEGIRVADSVKYQHRKELGDEADEVSGSGLVSAVPNDYIDSLSIRKKQLVVSLPSAHDSQCAQSKTSVDSSVRLCMKNKPATCNGLMSSLFPAGGDDPDLPSGGYGTSLHSDAAQMERCSEAAPRPYSCGDQLTATWWRLLDHATSISDLRGLPRSLSRFCCSTWRTFTGVKSPCIDVSKLSNTDSPQPCESSGHNINRASTCAVDEVMEKSLNPWWHKPPVSPDRRRLIDIGSDSSVCGDSPAKRVSLDNAQSLCQRVSESQLSDSDDGGSYVSLRVDCESTNCHEVPDATLYSENVPNRCRTDGNIRDEDNTFVSVMELPATWMDEDAQKQTGDTQKLFPAASVSNSTSLDVSQSPCFDAAVQPMFSDPGHWCTSSRCSGAISLTQSDQFLPSHNDYINVSLGLQSCSLDSRSATLFANGTSSDRGRPAEISAETNSVPKFGSDSILQLDNLAVHAPRSAGEGRLSCNSSSSSDEPLVDKLSWTSSNRLLRLIRRGSTKAQKQPVIVLPTTSSAVVAERCANSTVLTDSVAVTAGSSTTAGNSRPPSVHRLPSPNVPPPPVPDGLATSRLFRLCHTSVSEHSPMADVSVDSDVSSHYEELPCVSSAKNGAGLSASYSAGDKRHCDNEMSTDSVRLLARTASHRHRHVRQSSLELLYRPRCASDRSEVMSVQSSGSDNSRLSAVDAHRCSSTTGRRRPRYGTEYQRVDRRHGDAVDDCSTASSTPQASPYSIASSSVFTFDGFGADVDDQPPPLPVRTRRSEPAYVNLDLHARSALDSGSTSQVELNYAEIDLSDMPDSRCRLPTRTPAEPTPYAVIDLEATAAAAQTGREHARLREGLLHAKSFRRPGVTVPKSATLGRYSRPCAHRKSSMPSNIRETSFFDITRWT